MTEKKIILLYTDVQYLGKTNNNLDKKKLNATGYAYFSTSANSIKIFSEYKNSWAI